jgi:hypothetical protein
MLWDSGAQTFLSGGGQPNFHLALTITPILISTGNPVSVGYWTGMEDIDLPLGGVTETLFASKGALDGDNPTYAAGTDIRRLKVWMNGLSQQALDLISAYDIEQCPAAFWQLCFSQGMEFKGARRLFKGWVDEPEQTVGPKGGTSRFALTLASTARAGTKTVPLKKSHQSYLRRGGDTAMEYASLLDADSDWWGPRG